MKRQSHQDGPQRKIGEEVPETTRDTEVKETNQSDFDPAGVKSLLNVDERDKGASATSAETALGRVELWKIVGRNASILENFENARCDSRNQGRWSHHRA